MGNKVGSIKTAAKKAGMSVRAYLKMVADGMKKCTLCGEWKPTGDFDKDKSRGDKRKASCRKCSKAMWRIRSLRRGPNQSPERNDDADQARHRINADVRMGLRPNPNDLFCAMCGHKGPDKRHEYHHPRGYGLGRHNDTIPVCSACHSKEHRRRGHIKH